MNAPHTPVYTPKWNLIKHPVLALLTLLWLTACSQPSPASFKLALEPTPLSLKRSTTASVKVNLIRTNGFEGAVGVKLSNPPEGITAPELTIPAGSLSGQLSLNISNTAVLQLLPASLNIEGSSGSLSHQASLSYTVAGAAGSLDETFAQGGKKVGGSANGVGIRSVAVDAQGNTVALGQIVKDKVFYLFRFTPGGSADPSFGLGGIASSPALLNLSAITGQDLVIGADGKIVVVGSISTGSDWNFAVARFNSNGSPDTSFDGDGVKVSPLVADSSDSGNAVALQGDKILLGGSYTFNNVTSLAILRYTSEGKLDSTFGSLGITAAKVPGSSETILQDMAVQSDGKIVVAGQAKNPTNLDFFVARFDFHGKPDPSFGNNGFVTTDLGSSDEASSLALQGDKIVVVGTTHINLTPVLGAVRYTQNGSLDNIFGSGGIIKDTSMIGTSAAVQSDGQILFAGSSIGPDGNRNFALARYQSNGSLEPSFGTGGRATADLSSGWHDGAAAMTLQTDGRIVLAGSAQTGLLQSQIAVARFWP